MVLLASGVLVISTGPCAQRYYQKQKEHSSFGTYENMKPGFLSEGDKDVPSLDNVTLKIQTRDRWSKI